VEKLKTEHIRRVRFAEVDYSQKEHHKWILNPEEITYPNILIYHFGQPKPMNPWTQDFTNAEEVVNYLQQKFLKETNFYVPKLTCKDFLVKRAASELMTVYVGDYNNLMFG